MVEISDAQRNSDIFAAICDTTIKLSKICEADHVLLPHPNLCDWQFYVDFQMPVLGFEFPDSYWYDKQFSNLNPDSNVRPDHFVRDLGVVRQFDGGHDSIHLAKATMNALADVLHHAAATEESCDLSVYKSFYQFTNRLLYQSYERAVEELRKDFSIKCETLNNASPGEVNHHVEEIDRNITLPPPAEEQVLLYSDSLWKRLRSVFLGELPSVPEGSWRIARSPVNPSRLMSCDTSLDVLSDAANRFDNAAGAYATLLLGRLSRLGDRRASDVLHALDTAKETF